MSQKQPQAFPHLVKNKRQRILTGQANTKWRTVVKGKKKNHMVSNMSYKYKP